MRGTPSPPAHGFQFLRAICGGAAAPQIMGSMGDAHGMSKAFVVPLLCFAFVGAYGYLWPRLSGHEGMVGVNTTKGH